MINLRLESCIIENVKGKSRRDIWDFWQLRAITEFLEVRQSVIAIQINNESNGKPEQNRNVLLQHESLDGRQL